MKLLDQVRDVAARRHLAQATIECYLMWIVHFLRFCKLGGRWREPRELGADNQRGRELALDWLAAEGASAREAWKED